MKDFFDRLGLYDYLGIWGPGVITLTYFLFTLQAPMRKLFQFMELENPGLEQGYMVIILYTVVAYMIGVILHEAGKLFSDHFLKLTPEKCMKNAYGRENVGKFFGGVRNDFKTSIEENIPEVAHKKIPFHQANYGLRLNSKADKKKVESYHAVYALSRSLFLCFLIHPLAEVLALITGCVTWWNALIMIILDAGCIFLFWVRTIRYYYSWVKNLVIHYYMECKPEEKHAEPEKVYAVS